MSRISLTALVALLFALLLPGLCHAELREMTWERIDRHGYKVPRNNDGYLIVESTIEGLVFDSSNRIIGQESPEPGIYRVRVAPGRHLLTIKADGFVTLQGVSLSFAEKQVVGIRVVPKVLFGPSDMTADRGTLVVRMAPPAPGVSVVGALDGDPPQRLDFGSGEVILRPTAGDHTIEIIRDGRLWTATFRIAEGETVELEPSFGAARKEIPELDLGFLHLESSPPGATIMINDVKQPQTTPWTVRDLSPGTYRISIEREAYLPESRVVRLGAAESLQEHFDLRPNFAHITLNTRPAGAAIRFDGSPRGVTPQRLEEIAAGTYEVRFELPLYHARVETLTVESGKNRSYDFDLAAAFGSVRIESDPPGATVRVEGEDWGATPVVREQVPSGEYRVRVGADNTFTDQFTMQVRDGEFFRHRSELRFNVGFLTITSEPTGATVRDLDNGRTLGRTPLRRAELDPGRYRLRIERDLFEPVEIAAGVVRGEEAVFQETLERMQGQLSIISQPAGASIRIEGRDHGKTPAIVTLPTGEYEVRLDRAGYDVTIIDATVNHDQRTTLEHRLSTAGTDEWRERRGKARRLSLLVPGGGQYVSGQSKRGTVYLVGFLAALGLATKSEFDIRDQNDVFDAAIADYRAAISQDEMDRHFQDALDARSSIESTKDEQKTFLMVAGGIYVLQLFDALIFGGGDRPVDRDGYGMLGGEGPVFAGVEGTGARVGVRVGWP